MSLVVRNYLCNLTSAFISPKKKKKNTLPMLNALEVYAYVHGTFSWITGVSFLGEVKICASVVMSF